MPGMGTRTRKPRTSGVNDKAEDAAAEPGSALASDAAVRLARELIRTPSQTGSEGPAAELLTRTMRELGYDEAYIDDAGNAIGVIRRGEGPVVMLNGHIDTVPVGDESLWPHPPLEGVIADGRLYGRGACDMKGAVACMVVAAADAAQAGFSGTLIVSGVVQEEVGGLGARHLRETLSYDVAVLGEPSKLQLKLGHRGRVELLVTFPGEIAHAAKAELGENALSNAARFIAAMDALELPTGGPLRGSSATPTRLTTYPLDGANVVPGRAELIVDYRNVPGDEPDDIVARLRALSDDERVEILVPLEHGESANGKVKASYPRFAPPYLVPADHPAVGVARGVLRDVLASAGRSFEEGTWWFCTDAPHLSKASTPVIGFGPGEEELAHTTNESVAVSDLVIARRAYRDLALAYLGA